MSTAVLPIAEDGPVDGESLPVVVWSPGMGTPRWLASGLLMDLASRGYVVVAVDHAGESPAVEVAGRVQVGSPPNSTDINYMRGALEVRVSDVRMVVDRLGSLPIVGPRLDLSGIAMAGHSYGGQTTVSALASDPRIRTGVVLDGSAGWDGVTPPPSVDRPVMLLASGDMLHASWIRFAEATRGGFVLGTVRGAGHYTATDLPAIAPSVELCGTLSADRSADITRTVVAAFLGQHLRGESVDLPIRPELQWRTNRPGAERGTR